MLIPQGNQHDIDMAYLLVNHLDIKHYVVNIKDAVKGVLNNIPTELQKRTKQFKICLPE